MFVVVVYTVYFASIYFAAVTCDSYLICVRFEVVKNPEITLLRLLRLQSIFFNVTLSDKRVTQCQFGHSEFVIYQGQVQSRGCSLT